MNSVSFLNWENCCLEVLIFVGHSKFGGIEFFKLFFIRVFT